MTKIIRLTKEYILLRIVILIFIPILSLFSSDFNTTEENFIDVTHEYISEKVDSISNKADDMALETINYTKSIGSDDNKTKSQNKKSSSKNLDPQSVDALFQNEKYIEETKKSFLRLSTDYSHNSIQSNDFNIRLSAKLAFNKSQKNLKLYLSGFNQDNIDDIIKRDDYDDGKPEIGVSYLVQFKNNIKTKYSLGVRSMYPYVKGRFSYLKNAGTWLIEPVQTIEYSIKDEFREDTKLYLDTEVIEKVKFRLEFSRGSQSKSRGMDYASIVSLFWTPQSRTGLELRQGIYGNTKYEYISDEAMQKIEVYSGINNYVTTLTFRQNIYRKWLFYEVSPGVDFQKNHDFNPNYRFYVRLDAFFGKM
jgi:hypothetical protein